MTLEEVLPNFLEEPGGHIVMDLDLRIVEVGPEFARLTKNKRKDLLGKLFLNVIAEPNHARHQGFTEEIRASVAAATKTKRTHKMPVMRIDILDPETKRIEERWWRPALAPVLEHNQVQYLVLRMEDVTTEERAYRMILAQRRSNYILYGLVLACVAGIITIALIGFNQTSKQSKLTCQTSEQLTKGNQLLGNIMSDISQIIVNSPATIPPATPKIKALGQQLEKDLVQYLDVVHNLPTNRRCV